MANAYVVGINFSIHKSQIQHADYRERMLRDSGHSIVRTATIEEILMKMLFDSLSV